VAADETQLGEKREGLDWFWLWKVLTILNKTTTIKENNNKKKRKRFTTGESRKSEKTVCFS
jgi:hypothetical protein